MSEEMKIIGVLAFLVVFVAMFVVLSRSGKSTPSDEQVTARPNEDRPAVNKAKRKG